MPEFLIANNADIPRYARLDPNGKIYWESMANATGFSSEEDARKLFSDAAAAMFEAFRVASEKALLTKKIMLDGVGLGYPFFRYRSTAQNARTASTAHELVTPIWLWQLQTRQWSVSVGSRSTPDDLLGVFDLFYVRSDQGWLCRPQRKDAESMLAWIDSFGLAASFTTEEAAAAALAKHTRFADGHVVKSTSAFTAVKQFGRPNGDDTVGRIKAACEARDMRAVMSASAADRLQAMNNAGAASAPPEKKPQARKTGRL